MTRLGKLFQRREHVRAAADLYTDIVAQARSPAFYRNLGVPDTLDGRFEMVALHAFLVIRRLTGVSEPAARVTQALFDAMFADMDRSLREMGVGDLGVARRVKKMVSGFLGRSAAYESGLASGDEGLAAALRRNAYGTVSAGEEDIAALTAYVRAQATRLESQAVADLLGGRLEFGAPPGDGEDGAR